MQSESLWKEMNRDAIDFENGRVSTLFRRILMPTLLGSLAISAVTAIDGIFIGHGVGADGVAAVNIVVPIYQIMAGLGLMIGAGCSVVSSIHVGRHKLKAACMNVTQALVGSSLVCLLITAAIMIWPTETARLLGSSETLLPQVRDYLLWIMPCFVFEMWSFIGLFIIRLDGAPRVAMWCNIIPCTLNGVLDWVFIFPLGMGVKGAAIATGISIAIGGIMTLGYLLFFSHRLRPARVKWSRKSMHLTLRNIGYQCRIGSASLLGELTLAVLTFVGNLTFMYYLGDDGVGAFGIACYYSPFFFMIGNAIAQSAQPIISYDFGTGRGERIRQALRLMLITASAFAVVVIIGFVLFPEPLTALFVDTQSVAGRLAIEGFPFYATGILFYIFNIALTGYYQSLENMRRATLIVVLRTLLLIPSFALLPLWLGAQGIWLAMPVAEMCTLLMVFITRITVKKRL